MVLILNASEAEALLDIDECFQALEQVYKDLAHGRAVNRPRSHTFMPATSRDDGAYYLLKSIEGGSAELGVYALRVNSELWVPPNEQHPRIRKVPALDDGRYTEFIMLFSAENGRLLAILPDGHIQKMRVALTHALASKYLARADSRVLGLFGSGWQSGAQALVQSRIHALERIQVYSPNPEHRKRFVDEFRGRVEAEVVSVDAPEEVMRDADIVIGATDATSAVIFERWTPPGVHISSLRSRTEIEPALFTRADRVVLHNKTVSFDHWCGDLPHSLLASEQLGLDRDTLPELADVVGGKSPGRERSDEITVFVDGDNAGGPGLGIQFAAVGYGLFRKAREQGVGHEVPLDWFVDREDHPYLVDQQRKG